MKFKNYLIKREPQFKSQRKSKNTYQQIADEITEILTEQKKLESEFDESAISDTTRTIKQLTTDLIGF